MTEPAIDCGSSSDPEFFAALTSVFAAHPEAAGRYAIARARELIDPEKGEKARLGTLKNVEGRLLVQFMSPDEQPPPGASHCYLWEFDHETSLMKCVIWYYTS